MQLSVFGWLAEVKSDALSLSYAARTVPTDPCRTNITGRMNSKSRHSSYYPRIRR